MSNENFTSTDEKEQEHSCKQTQNNTEKNTEMNLPYVLLINYK